MEGEKTRSLPFFGENEAFFVKREGKANARGGLGEKKEEWCGFGNGRETGYIA